MLKFFYFFLLFSFSISSFAQVEAANSTKAKVFIEALAKKDFAKAHSLFTDEVKNQFPAEDLSPIWALFTDQLGKLIEQGKATKTKTSNGEKIATICRFEKGFLAISIAFNENGEIQGFFSEDPKIYDESAPLYKTPNYADVNLFEEKEVVVGQSKWALPATLTMPKNKRNIPAVVLVHGSGAHDRDETLGNNKIFKDLAWGLASKGIGVLRYEKRNKQYPKEFTEIKNRTVDDETVNDALAAVRLLRQTPNVKPTQIYILGHSLGGMMIPRIGNKDKQISGLIVMAGTARPLEDTIWEQYNYLASIDGIFSPEEKEFLNNEKKEVDKIKSLQLSDSDTNFSLLGFPVSYWIDWKTYDPTVIVKTLNQPMLILQGEKDYQVTIKDFQLWKDALQGRKAITFISYPNLTHIFMEGFSGKPSPKDYDKTDHVKEKVVNDIANWILSKAR